MATKAELINLLRGYAQRYGIDEGIAIAQIDKESRFQPHAISPAGARGIAQFMPATATRFGVNVNDVNSSFDGWGRYMRWLLDRFNSNYSLALAGYNAGEGNVDKYHGIPPFAETQQYVRTILANAGSTPSADSGSGYDNFFGIPFNWGGEGESEDTIVTDAEPAYGSYEEYLAATQTPPGGASNVGTYVVVGLIALVGLALITE